MSSQHCDADDLTLPEGIAGMEIVKKLQEFYEITDDKIAQKIFFIRFLVWIRESFVLFPIPPVFS